MAPFNEKLSDSKNDYASSQWLFDTSSRFSVLLVVAVALHRTMTDRERDPLAISCRCVAKCPQSG